jgi:hypothetical protein
MEHSIGLGLRLRGLPGDRRQPEGREGQDDTPALLPIRPVLIAHAPNFVHFPKAGKRKHPELCYINPRLMFRI